VLAKMASRAAKPDGLLVIEPEAEMAFLKPLPVEALWGVGDVTAGKLRAHGISTIDDLGRRDETELAMFLGGHAARHLHAIAHSRDPRRVRRGQRRRSIGTQSAFAGGGKSGPQLDALLVTLVDRVTRRARAANRAGRTVTLRFRFRDFSRATRSRTLPYPTAGTGAILAAARAILVGARPLIECRGLTLLGITVANLSDEAQLELPLEPRIDPALDLAIDEIRKRFGNEAIRRGSNPPSTPRHVSQV
jgi:DNA polymerase-4